MSLPTISLAEFNRLASGSYNAGQVDFKKNSAGEYTGELVKINNHVIFKSKNNIHLSGERVVAIAVGDFAYMRPSDGVLVCPISALRP